MRQIAVRCRRLRQIIDADRKGLIETRDHAVIVRDEVFEAADRYIVLARTVDAVHLTVQRKVRARERGLIRFVDLQELQLHLLILDRHGQHAGRIIRIDRHRALRRTADCQDAVVQFHGQRIKQRLIARRYGNLRQSVFNIIFQIGDGDQTVAAGSVGGRTDHRVVFVAQREHSAGQGIARPVGLDDPDARTRVRHGVGPDMQVRTCGLTDRVARLIAVGDILLSILLNAAGRQNTARIDRRDAVVARHIAVFIHNGIRQQDLARDIIAEDDAVLQLFKVIIQRAVRRAVTANRTFDRLRIGATRCRVVDRKIDIVMRLHEVVVRPDLLHSQAPATLVFDEDMGNVAVAQSPGIQRIALRRIVDIVRPGIFDQVIAARNVRRALLHAEFRVDEEVADLHGIIRRDLIDRAGRRGREGRRLLLRFGEL